MLEDFLQLRARLSYPSLCYVKLTCPNTHTHSLTHTHSPSPTLLGPHGHLTPG